MSVAQAARIVRLLWKAARAVRAVRTAVRAVEDFPQQEFAQDIVRAAHELTDQLGGPEAVERMSDEQLAGELEGRVQFQAQERPPEFRDFIEGPDETRAEHLASTKEFQKPR